MAVGSLVGVIVGRFASAEPSPVGKRKINSNNARCNEHIIQTHLEHVPELPIPRLDGVLFGQVADPVRFDPLHDVPPEVLPVHVPIRLEILPRRHEEAGVPTGMSLLEIGLSSLLLFSLLLLRCATAEQQKAVATAETTNIISHNNSNIIGSKATNERTNERATAAAAEIQSTRREGVSE